MNRLTVGVETPRQAEVLDLLQQSDAYSTSLYPGRRPQAARRRYLKRTRRPLFVARLEGVAVSCCALIEQGGGMGELKRMIVDKGARQQGTGRALLTAVEASAVRIGLHLIQMEVGARSIGAHALYRAAGYRDCGPFGAHRISPHSIFLEKQFGTDAA